MAVDIAIKNYRCFPDSKPARIALSRGFTALIGANNSGKSSLLKFFFEFRSLFSMLSSPTSNLIDALEGNAQGFSRASSIVDDDEVFSNTNGRNLEIDFEFGAASAQSVEGGLHALRRVGLTLPRGANTWVGTLDVAGGQLERTALDFEGTLLRHKGHARVDLAEFFQVCRNLSKTLYVGPFRNAINVGSNDNYFDIQVGQAFIRAWKEFKSGTPKRRNEAAYALTEDIKAIFGFTDLQINPSPDDTTLQVFINGKSYRLPELGSGMTQFIILLANAAVREPSYILIDEPELNLHPSLQLDFLTTLASYASEGIIFGTHSIGLARASADRIYSLRSVAEGESEVTELERTPRLSEFLGEMSFSGYRELGFDKVLLVEGVTDVKTIQQFLRLHKKDHEIVMLPLGGSQMIAAGREAELEEIRRISQNVCALIDSERAEPNAPLSPDRQAFVEACVKAGMPCHVLKRRGTENYLSDGAVKRWKGDKYRALGPYESRREAPLAWSKEENWRIAREMTLSDLDGTDLGEFLASL